MGSRALPLSNVRLLRRALGTALLLAGGLLLVGELVVWLGF